MIATIILGIFAVLFAVLANFKNFRFGLEISFFLIFLFLSLRYNFGNDYQGYYRIFNDMTNSAQLDLNYKRFGQVIEPGWSILCWLFKPYGFYWLIAFHSFLLCLAYYIFFKSYIPKYFYWLSILILIFDPTLLLIQLSALRQALATILIILSYQYIIKKNLLLFLVCIASASLFHISALFFLPVYLLGYLKFQINNIAGVLIFILFLILTFYGKLLIPLVGNFISTYFERYDNYVVKEGEFGTGLRFAYYSLLLLLTLYVCKFQKNETALILNLSILSFFIFPIGLTIDMARRFGYYFQPAILASFPILINQIKLKPLKIVIVLIIIIFTLRSYYTFMNSDIFRNAYLTYGTIFSIN